jgi:signal transduction histidine kinase
MEDRIGKASQSPQVDLSMGHGSKEGSGRSTSSLRLSVRGKLILSVLVASLPLAAVATWQLWGTPMVWLLWLCGFFSLMFGLVLVSWANRPFSDLAIRARSLAGAPHARQQLLGLVRTDLPGDEVLSDALDRIEQSLQEIQSLNRISQMVASDENLEHILAAIIEEAVGLLDADAGIIGSWDPAKMVFRDVAACNLPIMFQDREFSVTESFSSEVAGAGEVRYLDDYMQYPHRLKELDRFGLRAGLGAPMTVKGQSVGALTVYSTDSDRRFSRWEGQLLATFANQAGAAFEKERLHRLTLSQLEELSRAREDLARESRELERALSNMVKVQEEERSRIAADVHDGVVQMMVGSLCELQAAMAHFPHSPDIAQKKQERARQLIRDSITELRRVIFDLRPITLDAAGLVPAVENLEEDLVLVSGLQMKIVVAGAPCRLLPEVEIGAYRIVQEAVNNAVKHADAASVEVKLRFADGLLEILVSDDGRGFSVQEATSIYGKNAGLIGMQERARSLGGRLAVSSAVGRGTLVKAAIPCQMARRIGSGIPESARLDIVDGDMAADDVEDNLS